MLYLKRKIDAFLSEWKANPDKKPLIVKGPRQVGKTESIQRFAAENYTSVIMINFVEEPKYKMITVDGYKAADIIKNISRIDPSKRFIEGETLIFFDELQEFPDIATALKFFKIDGRFDVICSGSMLGINYRKIESNSDLSRFAEYGRKGVLALLSDSTNAERPGYTPSEKSVGDSFENLFRKANKKRIVVATFASNIHRVQQIIDVACARHRKVAVVGRSLENLVKVGSELGYLNVPQGILIDINTIKNYSDDQLVIITTGSQGEPMSALTKIAFGAHTKVTLSPNDYVIISATPIPGNEKMVGNVVNELMRHGVEVIYEKMYDVHVSGHACQEELKLMIGLVKPKYFIPVHGEQKHLQKHAKLGEAMGAESPR